MRPWACCEVSLLNTRKRHSVAAVGQWMNQCYSIETKSINRKKYLIAFVVIGMKRICCIKFNLKGT